MTDFPQHVSGEPGQLSLDDFVDTRVRDAGTRTSILHQDMVHALVSTKALTNSDLKRRALGNGVSKRFKLGHTVSVDVAQLIGVTCPNVGPSVDAPFMNDALPLFQYVDAFLEALMSLAGRGDAPAARGVVCYSACPWIIRSVAGGPKQYVKSVFNSYVPGDDYSVSLNSKRAVVLDLCSTGMRLNGVLSQLAQLDVTVVNVIAYFNRGVYDLADGEYLSGMSKISVRTEKRSHYSALAVGPMDVPIVGCVTHPAENYRILCSGGVGLSGHAARYSFECTSVRNGIGQYRFVLCSTPRVQRVPVNFLSVCRDDMARVELWDVFEPRVGLPVEFYRRPTRWVEVRERLLKDVIAYLVSKDTNADLIQESIRYMTRRNYFGLYDGVRIEPVHSLSYADLISVALVAAVEAYRLRYDMTSFAAEAIPRARMDVRARRGSPLEVVAATLTRWFETHVKDKLRASAAEFRQLLVMGRPEEDARDFGYRIVWADRKYLGTGAWLQSTRVQTVYNKSRGFVGTVPSKLVPVVGNDVSVGATLFPEGQQEELPVQPYRRSGSTYFRSSSDLASVLQDFYDRAFPGNSTTDIPDVAQERLTAPIRINTHSHALRIAFDKSSVKSKEVIRPRPALRTSVPYRGDTGLVSLLLATSKRNFTTPDIADGSDAIKFSRDLIVEMITNCCVPGALSMMAELQRDPLRINAEDFLHYLATRDEAYVVAMESEFAGATADPDVVKFYTIVKSVIKPHLSVAASRELGVGQVIVHQDKAATALYSSLFRQLATRFDNLLLPKYKLAMLSSDEDVSLWFSRHRHVFEAPGVLLEVDAKKFDKSQQLLSLLLCTTLYEFLGLELVLSDIWKSSFVSTVSSKTCMMSFILAMQMKSGAASTMFSNSLLTLVSQGHAFGYADVMAFVFQGDDGVVKLSRRQVDADHGIGKIFNLEIKVVSDRHPYFCSGFILHLGDSMMFAPDPLKRIESLGDPTGDETLLRARFESFKDLVSPYQTPGVSDTLEQAVYDRYGVDGVRAAVDALVYLGSDFSAFRNLVTFHNV